MLGNDGVDEEEDGVLLLHGELSDLLESFEEVGLELHAGNPLAVLEDELVAADAEDPGDAAERVQVGSRVCRCPLFIQTDLGPTRRPKGRDDHAASRHS